VVSVVQMTPANGSFLDLSDRRNRPQRCSGDHEYDTKLSHPHGDLPFAAIFRRGP